MAVIMNKVTWLLLTLYWLLFFLVSSGATDFDILTAGQQLRDFDALVSPNLVYALSFFYPESSNANRYFGIRFAKDFDNTPLVWIANPEDPLDDTSGILTITNEGEMIISGSKTLNITINNIKPEAASSSSSSNNISVTLTNSGNLVLKAGKQIVWQSFEHPTDTFLPGMKVGMFGLKTKQPHKLFLTSWLSPQAATPGAFTLGIDPDDLEQLVIWWRDAIYWRSGSWSGNTLRNLPSKFKFNYSSSENDSYFTFLGVDTILGKNSSSCIQLTSSGDIGVNAAAQSESLIMTPYSLSLCEDDSTGCVPS